MSAYELQKETFRAMQRFYRPSECVKMLVSKDFVSFAANAEFVERVRVMTSRARELAQSATGGKATANGA